MHVIHIYYCCKLKWKVLHQQCFYNIFTIDYRRLIIISLNLNLLLRLIFFSYNNNSNNLLTNDTKFKKHEKSFSFLSQKLVSKKHKKFCDYFLELPSVEPNNLVVFWGQVCDNPLATRVWGQILSKDNNFVPPSYLFFYSSFVLNLFFHYYFA